MVIDKNCFGKGTQERADEMVKPYASKVFFIVAEEALKRAVYTDQGTKKLNGCWHFLR